MSTQKYARRSSELAPKLLFLNETVKELYLHTSKTCFQLRQIDIFDINKHQMYDIDEFNDEQLRVHRAAVAMKSQILSDLVDWLSFEGERRLVQSLNEIPSVSAFPENSPYQPYRSTLDGESYISQVI